MLITKYCFCCNKESDFYTNKNTGKSRSHCDLCCIRFNTDKRKIIESNNIFKMLVNTKELNANQ